VWDALIPRERGRGLHLLIEDIEYDGRTGDLELALSPAGVAVRRPLRSGSPCRSRAPGRRGSP
jgi:hypothetical protein